MESDLGKEELITADPVGVIAVTHLFLSDTCQRSRQLRLPIIT